MAKRQGCALDGRDALGSSANHRVMIKPLSQVDEKFAWDEGEGDDTREWWLLLIAGISLSKPRVKGSI